METFKRNSPQELPLGIKNVLDKQIDNESVENFRFVIQSIADSFSKALDAHDPIIIGEALRVIKNKENYLAEKYRDTPEERFYIENVNKAIQYLESVLN